MRLDQFLRRKYPQYSRARLQRWIEEGRVRLDGKILQKSSVVTGEEDFLIDFPEEEDLLLPEEIPLDIVYEDSQAIIVNKPRGMVVHPSAGHTSGTLAHALLHYFPDITRRGGEDRPGIVHRLDKDTTGLLLVAKTDESWEYFHKKFKDRDILREYLTLVEGEVNFTELMIDLSLARSKGNPLKRAVEAEGKRALTEVQLEGVYEGFSLLRCRLKTGRTHQIRVHLQSIGHPIVGDPLYGGRSRRRKPGQLLHAQRLGFSHPLTGKWIELSAPLPEDFSKVLATMKEKEWK
ncbi:MAG: RluA family pseudouridine synthase [Bacillota bacterium]|nr:RluA family pseudouridine synthase [Bacillota bacterium]